MFGRGGPFGSLFGGDPFLSDPFAHMDRMMNSMFNDPFFANPHGGGLRPPERYGVQQAHQPRGGQPVIEEIDDAVQAGTTATTRDQPIVEEPDDESSPQDRAAQRQRRHSPQRGAGARAAPAPPPSMDPFGLLGALVGGAGGMGGGAGGSSFMFSSSSYSSMGPGGVAYQASSTTRVGPGGVRETQSVVRDGRSGTEAVTISRGLGDGRQRTLVRTRDARTGREDQLEDLHGIEQEAADVFDDQWRYQAEQNLPGGGAFGAASRRIAAGAGNSGSRSAGPQRPLALPSSTGGTAPPSVAAQPRATYMSPAAVHVPASGSGRSRQPNGVSNSAAAGRAASMATTASAATAGGPIGRNAHHGSYAGTNPYNSRTGGSVPGRYGGVGEDARADGSYASRQYGNAYAGNSNGMAAYPADGGGGYAHSGAYSGQQVQPRYRV